MTKNGYLINAKNHLSHYRQQFPLSLSLPFQHLVSLLFLLLQVHCKRKKPTTHNTKRSNPIFLSLLSQSSMASKFEAFFLFSNLFLLLASFATSNIDQDRTDCSEQLIGLAPCLPYVSGDAKTPTIDCCSGLKQVVQKSKKCLCVLIKDKDDPNLGLKINGSLALALPNACHVPANITECISLLHLAPNSTEAKIFKESNPTNGQSSSPDTKVHGSSSSANEKSDGGMGNRWVGGTEMIIEILLGFFILSHLNLMFI